MKIVGTSGISILLAGQVMMRHDPTIYLKDSELVNHHSAVLRFKTDDISRFLNIPFKQVVIEKAISFEGKLYTESNLAFQNMYSYKVTGRVINRSIKNINSEVRYIAPDNLFELMTIGLNIKLGCDLEHELFSNNGEEPILSYVKMPDVMRTLDYPNQPPFEFHPVYTTNTEILKPYVNVYQTIYYPGNEKYYRVSITKNKLIVEYIKEPLSEEEYSEDVFRILENDFRIDFSSSRCNLGNIVYNKMPVGKMVPIDEGIRKKFIYELTDKYNIWSFGRNGIWKSIRLDDLYHDLMKIDKMIRSSSKYELNLERK